MKKALCKTVQYCFGTEYATLVTLTAFTCLLFFELVMFKEGFLFALIALLGVLLYAVLLMFLIFGVLIPAFTKLAKRCERCDKAKVDNTPPQ